MKEKFYTTTTPGFLKQLREATPELLWVNESIIIKDKFIDNVVTVDQDGNMITVCFPDPVMGVVEFKVEVEYLDPIPGLYFDTIDQVIHYIKVNHMLDEHIKKFLNKLK